MGYVADRLLYLLSVNSLNDHWNHDLSKETHWGLLHIFSLGGDLLNWLGCGGLEPLSDDLLDLGELRLELESGAHNGFWFMNHWTLLVLLAFFVPVNHNVLSEALNTTVAELEWGYSLPHFLQL